MAALRSDHLHWIVDQAIIFPASRSGVGAKRPIDGLLAVFGADSLSHMKGNRYGDGLPVSDCQASLPDQSAGKGEDETLPHWDDILDLAQACAQIFAPIHYQSMDVAVTPGGPKLIEINTDGGFDLPQLASGRGFLTDEILGFFQECGVRLRGRR